MSISPSTLQLLSHVRNSNWKGQEMKIPFQKFGKYEPDSNLVHLFTCGDEKLKTHLLICICLALLTILTSVCLSLCSALHPGSFGSTWLNTGVWRQKNQSHWKCLLFCRCGWTWWNMLNYILGCIGSTAGKDGSFWWNEIFPGFFKVKLLRLKNENNL